MRHVFPSLSRPGFAYTFHTETDGLWEKAYRTARALGPQMGEFRTYGDGLTQHEIEYCATADTFADYCASLASWLLAQKFRDDDNADNGLDPEPFARLADPLLRRARIVFALGIKHAEGKYRYFNLRDCKTSSRSDLQYDKRWHKISDFFQGNVEGAFAAFRKEDDYLGRYLFEAWSIREEIRRVAVDLDEDRFEPTSARYFLESDDSSIAQAFEALRCVCTSLRQRERAQRQLSCWKSNNKIGVSAGEAA